MGHERIGFLPKSQRWKDIVSGLFSYSDITSKQDKMAKINEITKKTIENVRKKFDILHCERSVILSFSFLVNLSIASKLENSKKVLLENGGIELPDKLSLFSITKSAQDWLDSKVAPSEYTNISKQTLTDTIKQWYEINSSQLSLFSAPNEPYQVWQKASGGGGFSELARLFFANFTERYLKYFLDRATFSTFSNIPTHNQFGHELKEHVANISHHAFETAKITQSFAAGWYNANSKEGIPDSDSVQGFLYIAFGKMRSELLREANK